MTLEREAFLEDAGYSLIESGMLHHDVTDEDRRNLSFAVSILKALHLIHISVDYIVRDGQIIAGDEFTGRVVENRQGEPIVQATPERKEGLNGKRKSEVMNRITVQNFLRMYKSFAGMTGTARTSAGKFLSFYGKMVIAVPPKEPCQSQYQEFFCVCGFLQELTKHLQLSISGVFVAGCFIPLNGDTWDAPDSPFVRPSAVGPDRSRLLAVINQQNDVPWASFC